jgi:hypothetical protein
MRVWWLLRNLIIVIIILSLYCRQFGEGVWLRYGVDAVKVDYIGIVRDLEVEGC